jgi:hypothetical protein
MGLSSHKISQSQQHGSALIILVLILVMAGTTAIFSILDSNSIRLERDKKTVATLAEAKSALIGYMVSITSPLEQPGDLPCPDKSSDSNYDGTQDSPCSSTRIGRFPWSNVDHLGTYNAGMAVDLSDANGDRLWYAVSRNLVDPTNVSINSDLVTAAPYSWLSVYDAQGNLLSNRAVAVIISPGNVLSGQDRSAALPTAVQYLDSVTLKGITYNNAAASPTKFISGNVNDPALSGSVKVNDQVVFITIDEVMPLIEARVARDAKQCLESYAKVNAGSYPWAAPSSDMGYTSTVNTRFGRLPAGIFSAANCNVNQAWWSNWQNFTFYTFPVSYQPGGAANCVAAGDCLTVNGAGQYSALVLMGRNAIGAQNHAIPTNPNNFLDSTNATLATNYFFYKPSDVINFAAVNDLVVCLDGQNNCK